MSAYCHGWKSKCPQSTDFIAVLPGSWIHPLPVEFWSRNYLLAGSRLKLRVLFFRVCIKRTSITAKLTFVIKHRSWTSFIQQKNEQPFMKMKYYFSMLFISLGVVRKGCGYKNYLCLLYSNLVTLLSPPNVPLTHFDFVDD